MTNYFIHLNNYLMVKNLFFKHGSVRRSGVQTFALAPKIGGLK